MTYRIALIPALACASVLAGGPADAVTVSGAGTKTGKERAPDFQGAELTELLAAHGILRARRWCTDRGRTPRQRAAEGAFAIAQRPAKGPALSETSELAGSCGARHAARKPRPFSGFRGT